MSDVFIYQIDMPQDMGEAISPGWEDDYTIYVNRNHSYHKRLESIDHAFGHMRGEDFGKDDVQRIETEAHRKGAGR